MGLSKKKNKIAIVMGSSSDYKIMKNAEAILKILENINKYDKHKSAINLLPENVFPLLIEKIKESKNDQCK